MRVRDNLVLGSISAVLALLLAGADVSAQNLLSNPGFETGDLTGWEVIGEAADATVTVQSPDNGPSAPGTHHAFVDSQAEFDNLILRQSTAPGSFIPGMIDFSFDLKAVQLVNGAAFSTQLLFEQEGGGVLLELDFGYYEPVEWETISMPLSFDAPPNTDFLTVQFIFYTAGASSRELSMLMDNVSVVIEPTVPVESMNWGSIKAQYR